MKLQIASRLAVFAVLELAAHPDRQISAAEIADKYGVSTHHLAKVMHTLGRAGLVRSVRGAGGGYQFSGNAKRTTLIDIIQLFERVGDVENASGEPGEDTSAGGALRQILDEIDDITRATLSSVTVSTLLKLIDRRGSAGPSDVGVGATPYS
ncbi:MAG: Rrf2 family transcriptional regulator [Alphaproteobacteria bacterium]|nr:Rrf2 family transcriptional regulator [Alphaproteobacteria bacterium]